MKILIRIGFVLLGTFTAVSSFAPNRRHESCAVQSRYRYANFGLKSCLLRPPTHPKGGPETSPKPDLIGLHMAKVDGEGKCRRKHILKKIGQIARAAASIALATSVMPPAAHASTRAAVAENTFNVADLVNNARGAFEAADNTKKATIISVSAFAAGIGTSAVLSPFIRLVTSSPFRYSLEDNFPKARKCKTLVSSVRSVLRKHRFLIKRTLLATSFCADGVNRGLEREFVAVFGDNYSLGGLAGFPFGGISSFNAMASTIPDGGSCLVVFGPHVSIDSKGTVGSVKRRGKKDNGACCRPAIAAAGYVHAVHHGMASPYGPPDVPDDAQQNFVGSALLPYAAYLESATNKMAELPFALFGAQKKLMDTIVQAGAVNVPGNGKVAVLGGIQINTEPRGKSDYFLPLTFELYDNKGKLIEDMRSKIDCGRAREFVPTTTGTASMPL